MPVRICAAFVMLILLSASRMDLKSMRVRRWVWMLGGVPVTALMITRAIVLMQEGKMQETLSSCIFLLAFILLQQCLFARMYGRADCHAFCLCAAAFALMGYGFEVWVYQMATAYVLLAITQAFRRNIARSGDLKCPVPFMPYITVSFVLWVDFIVWGWYNETV